MGINLCNRLLEITKKILAATKAGNFSSLGHLLQERGEIMERLKECVMPNLDELRPIFQEIILVESECIDIANRQKESILKELTRLREKKRASSGYTKQYLKYVDDIH